MLRPLRRSLSLAATTVLVTALAALAGAPALPGLAVRDARAAAGDDFVFGSGRSDAQLLRVGPSAGRLSLAPVFGLALADYLNTSGRAESRVFDFAALDGSVPEEFKAEFPPVRSESTDKDSEQGRSATLPPSPDGAPAQFGATRQEAAATEAPRGRSSFAAGVVGIPGLFELRGARAVAAAGVVDGATAREASGVTTIGSLILGDGAVVLNGLRWEAVQRTGAGATVDGSFSIDGATIAGQPVALPAGAGDLSPVIDQANAVLAPIGIQLVLPRAHEGGGLARVGPLSITIVDSQVGNTLLAPAIAGLQPVKHQLAQFVFEHASDASGAVLLADVTLGVLSGAGRLDVQLGGVSAFTEGQRYANPFAFDLSPSSGSLGPATFSAPTTTFADAFADTPAAAAAPGTSAPAAPDESSATGGQAAFAGTTTIPGRRGGAAVAVGVVGLLAALGIGAADYRAMRVSRRTIALPQ